MKIKTIKIKVTQDNQDFDLSEFFTGSNTIYSTNAQLIQEEDGLYWHAFFTYKNENGFQIPKRLSKLIEEEKAPSDYEEEILRVIKKNNDISARVRNAIQCNVDAIYYFKTINEFEKLRNLGKKSILENEAFINEILAISKKHRIQK